jgi:uncharacterized membrane protein YvbJ
MSSSQSIKGRSYGPITQWREGRPLADSVAKRKWIEDNTIKVTLKINRNQDPELYQLLQQTDNKSGLIRELIKKATEAEK